MVGLKEKEVLESTIQEEECRSSFKGGVNEMPIGPTHDDMCIGHAMSGVGLLIPLGVDTIVTKFPSN